ncbi:flagellar assembly protein FliH [Legionella fairfieldensis]|uniref:flagellar assembly protein FliH n=1 Tax=Legionella fairfieldensis TaxID=45064 RepID=UPI00048FC0F8|nr:flagellar assembly protein FliH [Legionella fairfieldensis]
MDNDFQPLYEEKDKDAFDVWDIKIPEPEPVSEIDEKEELAKECERLREQAKQEGYQEGLRQAEIHVQQKQQELGEWIHFFQHPLAIVDSELNKEIVQTIIWICEACIGIELSVHPEKLAVLIDAIKQELPGLQGNKQLAMHPLDVEYLLDNFKNSQPDLTRVLIADPALSRGDFYIKDEYSELDGRLKTRLQTLFKSYLQDNNDSTDEPAPDEIS